MKSKLSAALAAACAFGATAAANADTITETFTVNVPGVFQFLPHAFPSTAFEQFNPALGTLTDVQTALTGFGTWTSDAVTPQLTANFFLLGLGELSGTQFFSHPGLISFNMAGTNTNPNHLAAFTGTGNAMVILFLDTAPNSGFETFMDTFGVGLSGTIKYDYAPSAVAGQDRDIAIEDGFLAAAIEGGKKIKTYSYRVPGEDLGG
jgi:hypothetical protein